MAEKPWCSLGVVKTTISGIEFDREDLRTLKEYATAHRIDYAAPFRCPKCGNQLCISGPPTKVECLNCKSDPKEESRWEDVATIERLVKKLRAEHPELNVEVTVKYVG